MSKSKRRPTLREKRLKSRRVASQTQEQYDVPDLAYAQALTAMAHARPRASMPLTSVLQPPHPELIPTEIGRDQRHGAAAIQINLMNAVTLMGLIGTMPNGDFAFDQSIHYRRLSARSLEWLQVAGVNVKGKYAPLTADYVLLFAGGERLPTPADSGKFFSALAECLLTETQILIAMQYFYGLGLYNPSGPQTLMNQVFAAQKEVPIEERLFSDENIKGIRLAQIPSVDLEQLHGRVFLEYCVVMLRAQWDKLVGLSRLVFGFPPSWADSVLGEGLKPLNQIMPMTPNPIPRAVRNT